MSREYHYLVAGLPDLLYDDTKQQTDLLAYRTLLADNLHPSDYELIKLYFNRYDNKNLVERLKNPEIPLDEKGILDTGDWELINFALKEDSISEGIPGIPYYICRFLAAHKEDTPVYEGKSWELQLSELYFEHAMNVNNSFIQNWFLFERNLQNIMTAWQCRKYKIPLENQITGIGEIHDKLVRSSARDFGLDSEFPHLEDILRALEEEELKESERRIDRIKWDFLDDAVFFHYFTIEKLFSFLVKLAVIERWLLLDKTTGKKLFNELLSSMETSYEFPAEFKLKHK